MAAEYVVREGNDQVMLCERGIKTFETSTRYTLDIAAVPVLKQETHLPVVVDPSHPAGRRDLVLPLTLAAVAAGADGVIVEVHPDPEQALSRRAAADPDRRVPRVRARGLRARRADGQDRGLSMPVRSLAVVGTGLIGASVALAARRAGVEDVRGYDPDEEALAGAVERGAVEAAGSLARGGRRRRARRRRGSRRAARRVGRGGARGVERARSPTSARRRAPSCAPRAPTRASSAAIRCAAPRRAGRRTRAPSSSTARRGFSRRSRRPTRSATARCTRSSPRSEPSPSRSTRTRTTGSSR